MNPERWQQISRIFNRAISLDAAARSAYVEEKCGTDGELKAEVERLIESHEHAEDNDFIGGLAVEDVAEHFTDDEEALALQKGQQFGSYLILDHLGTGGMGQVYLAQDSRLGRTVALKILSSDVADDERRMQRFRQEAKVTSSLNQPNILTIFESGEIDNLTFIAAEFVDGETLREYLRRKRPKLRKILDITIQILAALDAAHEAMIVHRDIKPDNVMIRRRDHVVKVLDFGLAKVSERKKPRADEIRSYNEDLTSIKTVPGLIMGTVNYMSPEQAQGKEVDARSDIWSTGVIVYEMVTGTKPFGGTTSAHTIVQILEKEPAPLTQAGAEVPQELQRIVAKSMAKDPDERYQTAKDMLIDLRNLRKRLELDAEGVKTRTSEAVAVRSSEKPNHSVVIALIVIGVVVAGIIGFNTWRGVRNRSQFVPTATPVEPAPAPRLTYWITVQKFKEGKPYGDAFNLAGEINFEVDYQIRLSVRSPQPGYLYLLNEGPVNADSVPEYVVLFPSPTANDGSEFVAANKSVQIPNQTWLRFDTEQGVEKLWLVFSDAPLSEFAGVNAFANARTRGLIKDAELNRAITGFLRSKNHAAVTPEKTDTLTTLKSTSKLIVYPIKLEHH